MGSNYTELEEMAAEYTLVSLGCTARNTLDASGWFKVFDAFKAGYKRSESLEGTKMNEQKTWNLKEIIEQLELCNYQCEGGSLKDNLSFIALKEIAEAMRRGRVMANNYTYRAKIIRVVDGDTIDCECDLPFYQKATHRFRLLGIDAPEQKGETLEAGRAATNYLRGLVLDKECIITSYKADSFGRWLADFKVGGTLLEYTNLADHLVQVGHAVRYER